MGFSAASASGQPPADMAACSLAQGAINNFFHLAPTAIQAGPSVEHAAMLPAALYHRARGSATFMAAPQPAGSANGIPATLSYAQDKSFVHSWPFTVPENSHAQETPIPHINGKNDGIATTGFGPIAAGPSAWRTLLPPSCYPHCACTNRTVAGYPSCAQTGSMVSTAPHDQLAPPLPLGLVDPGLMPPPAPTQSAAPFVALSARTGLSSQLDLAYLGLLDSPVPAPSDAPAGFLPSDALCVSPGLPAGARFAPPLPLSSSPAVGARAPEHSAWGAGMLPVRRAPKPSRKQIEALEFQAVVAPRKQTSATSHNAGARRPAVGDALQTAVEWEERGKKKIVWAACTVSKVHKDGRFHVMVTQWKHHYPDGPISITKEGEDWRWPRPPSPDSSDEEDAHKTDLGRTDETRPSANELQRKGLEARVEAWTCAPPPSSSDVKAGGNYWIGTAPNGTAIGVAQQPHQGGAAHHPALISGVRQEALTQAQLVAARAVGALGVNPSVSMGCIGTPLTLQAPASIRAAERVLTQVEEPPDSCVLHLEGLVVPERTNARETSWLRIRTGPVVGWALHHHGSGRLHSIWLRTRLAWYLVRRSPPFSPANFYRRLWGVPGGSLMHALSDAYLFSSPIASCYDWSVTSSPPKAGAIGWRASTSTPAPLQATRTLRLTSFLVVDAHGCAIDMFRELAPGSFGDGTATPHDIGHVMCGGAQGQDASDVALRLVGQAMPIPTHPVTGEAAASALAVDSANSTAGAESTPGWLWVKSAPVVEYCVVYAGMVSGAAPVSATARSAKVWVRTAGSSSAGTSDDVWYELVKPHLRIESWWSPPGTRGRPVPEALVSASYAIDAHPEGGSDGLPCRDLHRFRAALVPTFDPHAEYPSTAGALAPAPAAVASTPVPTAVASAPAAVTSAPAATSQPNGLSYAAGLASDNLEPSPNLIRQAGGAVQTTPHAARYDSAQYPLAPSLLSVLDSLGQPGQPRILLLGDVRSPTPSSVEAEALPSLPVLTGAIICGSLDYSVRPAALWVRTDGGCFYRLRDPDEAYTPLFQMPGFSQDTPISEEKVQTMLPLFSPPLLESPFVSKRKAYPSLRLSTFELLSRRAKPRSVLRAMPNGIRAKKTELGKEAPAANDEVYVRGRLIAYARGASSPWVWAGPLRAWSADFSQTGERGRVEPVLWVCTAHAAYELRPSLAGGSEVAAGSSRRADSSAVSDGRRPAAAPVLNSTRTWMTGDGLALRLTAEILAGCKEQSAKRTVMLYNVIVTGAWSRMPKSATAGLARNQFIFQEHVFSLLVEALGDAKHEPMAARLKEERARYLEQKQRSTYITRGHLESRRAIKSGIIGIGAVAAAAVRARVAEFSANSARTPGAEPDATTRHLPRVKPAAKGATGRKRSGEQLGEPSSKRPKPPPPEALPQMRSGADGVARAAKASSLLLRPAVAGALEPVDAEVCRILLSVLNKASVPLAVTALTLAAKSKLPSVPWNFAQWLLVVNRTVNARRALFARSAASTISLVAGDFHADDAPSKEARHGANKALYDGAATALDAEEGVGASTEGRLQRTEMKALDAVPNAVFPNGAGDPEEDGQEDHLFGDIGDL